jgi:hypothetical protein
MRSSANAATAAPGRPAATHARCVAKVISISADSMTSAGAKRLYPSTTQGQYILGAWPLTPKEPHPNK